MSELTDAETVTLESATYTNLTDDYSDDRTDETEVNRWEKKGDRLYINGPAKYEKNGTYFDLIAGDMQDLPGSRDVTVERDGNTVTITVADTGGIGYDEEWTIVLELEFADDGDDEEAKTHTCEECGDDFDTEHGVAVHAGLVHSDEDESEPEIVADGGEELPLQEGAVYETENNGIWRVIEELASDEGELPAHSYIVEAVDAPGADRGHREELESSWDIRPSLSRVLFVEDSDDSVTDHLDDETIESAIAQHDAPDHPDATTVEEVRDALAWLQQSMEEVWWDWVSNVENGESEVVYEDNDVIVFATGEQNVPRRDLREHYDGDLSERTPDVVSAVHHELARGRCDYDWGYEYPLVVRKRDGLEDGQRYVESVVNGLMQRGLSPGQAWAYYGVEIRGNSRNSWGLRKGDHDHKNVSDALEKAKKKLP
ncbi:hypothetical protein [Natrinema pallidum]|uniref:C2H2-type domain-containing protein n=1 Tax=Natrinema pallidum TaxID=69527 RepID=A0A4P9TM41_9EURY|nr:hypothetical protein [Natrinema pallidum]QCW05295.1 hypothetical protein FGF80_18820 [Natrinema pallidum]